MNYKGLSKIKNKVFRCNHPINNKYVVSCESMDCNKCITGEVHEIKQLIFKKVLELNEIN